MFRSLRGSERLKRKVWPALAHECDKARSLPTIAFGGLARAYAFSLDTIKSRTAYQDFFALWKDADPDIPILKEAEAEYEKLQ